MTNVFGPGFESLQLHFIRRSFSEGGFFYSGEGGFSFRRKRIIFPAEGELSLRRRRIISPPKADFLLHQEVWF